ncbi:hypothetical protein HELRODRAFT_182103 [Helobdella robusta]|uniref:Uncharacterized protein n=1 Tax=Helobdella robusta TaxID=6412 RepID=T1FHR4_HELRO|nr:hypothetical protein HELRODRAFT_182103 [Helobdella robusta]ESN91247.1 hypothetical protein HELRODRAFT_182103 [Helobdella robusta]
MRRFRIRILRPRVRRHSLYRINQKVNFIVAVVIFSSHLGDCPCHWVQTAATTFCGLRALATYFQVKIFLFLFCPLIPGTEDILKTCGNGYTGVGASRAIKQPYLELTLVILNKEGPRKGNDPRNHGVGSAVRTNSLKKITEVPVGVSEKLMYISLAKNRHMIILSAYAQLLTQKNL